MDLQSRSMPADSENIVKTQVHDRSSRATSEKSQL